MTGTEPRPPGVIFDLDGTLADTLQDLTDAVNAAMRWAGLPLHGPEVVRRYVGDGLPTLIRRAAGTDDAVRIQQLIEPFRDYYRQNYLRHTRLYPGIAAALTALQNAGCPLAVLSNKPDDFTKAMCQALLAEWRFTAFAGTSDRYPSKPDPTRALSLAAEMGRPPSEVFIVGDAPSDVATARAGGMGSVAVTWGFRDRADLQPAGPDRLVNRPDELPAAILGPGTSVC